ncbi:MAG: hypothetical protein KDD03_13255 [Gelidibacter sp.]|nr:hypothetical protein [Gelidibacter sp.]
MKTTQKQVIEIVKSRRLDVYSFNKVTGLRESTYGGLNPIQALNEVMLRLKAGYDVIVTERYEVGESPLPTEFKRGRLTYAEVAPFATSL